MCWKIAIKIFIGPLRPNLNSEKNPLFEHYHIFWDTLYLMKYHTQHNEPQWGRWQGHSWAELHYTQPTHCYSVTLLRATASHSPVLHHHQLLGYHHFHHQYPPLSFPVFLLSCRSCWHSVICVIIIKSYPQPSPTIPHLAPLFSSTTTTSLHRWNTSVESSVLPILVFLSASLIVTAS